MLPQTISISSFQLKDDKPIYQQIIDFLQEQIRSGQLRQDVPLPSSRQLAKQLNVHRNTVIEAYERLTAMGWLYSEERKGTFVAPLNDEQKQRKDSPLITFSYNHFTHLNEPMPLPVKKHYAIKFDDGSPDPKMAPILDLAMAYRRSYSMHLRLQKTDLMPRYPDHSAILTELDKLVGHYCGVRLDEQHSCFIMGILNALYLVGQVLFQKGDKVVVENPGDPTAWDVLQNCGVTLLPVDVDSNGLDTEQLADILTREKIKGVYVSPQVQYPTTATLSHERRKKLLELAAQYEFAILETDYDYEFWYEDKKVFPLLNEDRNGSVIYMSCLSKLMAPMSWISVVTGPPQFIRSLKVLASSLDHQGEVILETAVTRMMQEGIINRKIKKSQALYKAKRDTIAKLIRRQQAQKINFPNPNGGMAFWLELDDDTDMEKLHKNLQAEDIYFPDARGHWFGGEVKKKTIRFGFASHETDRIEKGLNALFRHL